MYITDTKFFRADNSDLKLLNFIRKKYKLEKRRN